jgi:hypothetical protein
LKHRIIVTMTLVLVFAIAPGASAAPPGGFSSESEWVEAEIDTHGGYLFIGASNYADRYPEGSFEGSSTYIDYFVETETGFISCFGFNEDGGPTVDTRLANATLTTQVEGECFAEEFGDEAAPEEGEAALQHEENGEHEEPQGIPFTATIDMTWTGEGIVLRSSSHSTTPTDVCQDKQQWRDAETTGTISLFAEGVVDLVISPAESNSARISRWESSCHSKGSPGP